MCKATSQINKVNVSEIENLKIGEEIVIENDVLIYAFTKIKIFDEEYLTFGIYAGGNAKVLIKNTYYLNKTAYEMLIEEINNEYDINLELTFDIEIK